MNWFAEVLDDLIAQNERLGPDALAELRRARDRISKEIGFHPRNPATETLMSQLEDAETLDQVAGIFGSMPREFGFDEATLIVLNEGGRYLSRRVLSSLPDEWWTDYNGQRLFEGDPLIDGIVAQEHELYLDELIPTREAPLRYLKAAQARGIGCNGVIFKIAYPTGLAAAVILNTARTPDLARSQFRKYRDDLQTLAHAACDALVYFSGVGAAATAKLSAEEIRFLRLVALSEDPAQALSMDVQYGSARTVQMQILRKLGVKSIFQAVLIAARRGLLDAAIFHPSEVVPTRPRVAGWDVLRVLSQDMEGDAA
jgi:DNA-binding CsgD family transcriptional regulator